MSKKAALELSINAIVIVILAMTLLGLGLGFVRGMFQNIGQTTDQVQDQVREQILDDLRTGDKKLSFPSSQVNINSGDEQLLAMGVKNTEPQKLNFKVKFAEIQTVEGVTTPVEIEPDQALEGRPFDMLWDSTPQNLGPGEAIVIPVTLRTQRTATGTKLLKITILELDESGGEKSDPTTGQPVEYAAKTFFVRFI
ncbi:MAG: hypothetical protein Q7S65_02050 [Nanoarchaeota archaeon]|nr:hypothetical protein [Nanoarchaeota archaeon]